MLLENSRNVILVASLKAQLNSTKKTLEIAQAALEDVKRRLNITTIEKTSLNDTVNLKSQFIEDLKNSESLLSKQVDANQDLIATQVDLINEAKTKGEATVSLLNSLKEKLAQYPGKFAISSVALIREVVIWINFSHFLPFDTGWSKRRSANVQQAPKNQNCDTGGVRCWPSGHILPRVSKRHKKTQNNTKIFSSSVSYLVTFWLNCNIILSFLSMTIEFYPNCKQTADR